MPTVTATKEGLLKRIEGLSQIPTIPAVLGPLVRYLQQPVEQLDPNKVADFIAQDKSLAAQCLHMANSPLFGRRQKVDTLRGAVVGLGFNRLSDIAMSCSVLNLLPSDKTSIDPVVFWEHSLGCALVCRQFARKIGFENPAKAYLSGLLHDLGIIVNLWVLPREFGAAFEMAKTESIPLHEAEHHTLGFNHCESGRLLAEHWGLPPDLLAVVAHHHFPEDSPDHQALVSIVQLSDLLCRISGLNHGYIEKRQVNLTAETGFAVLQQQCPSIRDLDWARLTFELDSYLEEVHSLVRTIYRT
jgi:HD-like signal output (HDOD) protein